MMTHLTMFDNFNVYDVIRSRHYVIALFSLISVFVSTGGLLRIVAGEDAVVAPLQYQQPMSWYNELGADNNGALFCHKLKSFSAVQARMCHLYQDHMVTISRAIQTAIHECQWQFGNHRWNCSVSLTRNASNFLFGPITNFGCRETGFTYAILAASVVHAVSRSCRDGELRGCGCSQEGPPKQMSREWVWGGCGDNVEYAYRFARSFIDAREREVNFPRHSRTLARMLMNLHNNEAGRRAIVSTSRVACKCHGVSGSCNLRTCWNQLAPFRVVGNQVKDSYDGASLVKFNRHGTSLIQFDKRFNKPTKNDLIFLDPSPDYCQTNESAGTLGTHARRCYPTSLATDGCDLMCCGRGYKMARSFYTERCQCKFHWCCFVQCKTCERVVDVYTCK